jgi:nicotinamidase/pyrazinamidase
MASAISINEQDVLLAIDLQADFMPGGALAVESGDEIVPLVNELMSRFENVVVTQDWHPPTHASFAASHENAKPFDTKRLHYGDQTLWPDHCVQGTAGAAFHPDLAVDRAFLILRKGVHGAIDSYSAFVEADGRTTTGLASLLKARGVKRVFACGLATDFCVAHSALDARKEGFETFVIEDACRAIDANDSLAEAWARMNAAEVWRVQSAEILGSRQRVPLSRES